MTHQTTGDGVPLSARWQGLSSPLKEGAGNPRRLYGIVAGKPSSGKTNLFLTCPGAFIINLDRSEITYNPNTQAGVWPAKNEAGECIGSDGRPFAMNWGHVEEMVTRLVRMAEQDQDRPELVVFDTLAGAIELGQEHIVKRADREEWKQIDGRRGWDDLYNMIVNAGNRLRNAGYGVYFTCHLVDKYVQLETEEAQREIVELTITSGFWKRLFWRIDICLAALSEDQTKVVEVEQSAGGRTRTVKKTQTKRVYVLSSERSKYIGITKSRVVLPDIELSRENAWSDFEQAYIKASSAE